jgi:hypothetical protein
MDSIVTYSTMAKPAARAGFACAGLTDEAIGD